MYTAKPYYIIKFYLYLIFYLYVYSFNILLSRVQDFNYFCFLLLIYYAQINQTFSEIVSNGEKIFFILLSLIYI